MSQYPKQINLEKINKTSITKYSTKHKIALSQKLTAKTFRPFKFWPITNLDPEFVTESEIMIVRILLQFSQEYKT